MKKFVNFSILKTIFTIISFSIVVVSFGQETSRRGILPQSDFSKNKDVSFASKQFEKLGYKIGNELEDATLTFKSADNSKQKIDLISETIRLVNSKGEEVFITKISDKIRKENLIITEQGNNINIVENGQMKQIAGNSVAKSSSICNSYINAAIQPCKNLISCISTNKNKCSKKKTVVGKVWCYTTSCAGSAFGCIGNVTQYIACIVANG